MKKSILVVGGGIAGLSAAYYLLQKAKQRQLEINLTLLESAPVWGGKIQTDRSEGFVIEGGPDTFLATKPWGIKLCRELGLDDRLFGTNPQQKNTYVLHQDELKALPEGLTMMIPTQFSPMIRTQLLSWTQKARMGMDFFLPPRSPNGDESLGNFVSRRLGRAAYENLIEPLMSGIYAGDGDQLSLQATFPYLHELEQDYGGLVKGALAVRRKRMQSGQVRKNGSSSRSIFLTPKTGLAELVEALVKSLEAADAELRLSTKVVAVQRTDAGYQVVLENGELLRAQGLVLAAPAFASGHMLAGLDVELAQELQSIPYVTTATISLAYREADLDRPLDGYGYVIPRREGRQALACTWTSTKFPHRAPEGMALVRVFVGRAGQEEEIPWSEAQLVKIAQKELELTLGITAQPVLERVYIWEKAMPQYNLGHPQRLERIQAKLTNFPGLQLAGNGYAGIGIPDCIRSGELAAESILQAQQVSAPQEVG